SRRRARRPAGPAASSGRPRSRSRADRRPEPIWAGTRRASDFAIEPSVPLTAVVVDSGDHQRFDLRLSNLPRADERYRVRLPYGRVIDLNGNPNVPSVSEDDRVYCELHRVGNQLPFWKASGIPFAP